MNDLVPSFGIEGYSARLAWVLDAMPRQVALVEAVAVGSLGLAAIALLLISVLRRSAVAAVGFSLVALTGLVVSLMFGRFDFITDGTKVLIVCLFDCSVLLFLTATVRLARDNSIVGLVVLAAIAGMLGAGVLSMLQVIDGWPVARAAIGGTAAFGVLLLFIEFMRGDRGTIAVTPGLLLAVASLPAMSFVTERASGISWMMTSVPILLLTGGVLLAVIAAQLTVSSAASPAPARKTVRRTAPVAPAVTVAAASSAMADNGPLLQEVEDEHHPVARPVERVAPAFEPEPELRHEEPQDDFAQSFEDEPAREPQPQRDWGEPARDYAARQDALPVHQPTTTRAVAPRDRFGERSEPYSAQWGKDRAPGFGARPIPIGDNEYVWDMMADREVRMGRGFEDMFAVGGMLATPDVIRDRIDERSLPDFDDAVLGGGEPQTGRFDIRVQRADGATMRLEGRRQVDQDGLLSRLELQSEMLAAAPAVPEPAPEPEPEPAPRATGLAAVAAPAAPALQEDAPLTAAPAAGAVAALDRGEIAPWFQPIVRLGDRKVVGFEALARWELPGGEVREAQEFVDDLIKAGRGPDLARVVIEVAAEELSNWVKAEPGLGQFVSVNIAATDLPKETVAEIVKAAVLRSDLPSGALVVELTEGKIQASHNKALAAAKAIRTAGASLAVDDFGVGYSTLNRLSKFRFDMVKLDKSLIADLPTRKKQRSIVRAMLGTAEKSGAPVVAEGIEDEETAALLVELGCDFGQGYLFGAAQKIERGEPVPAAPAPAAPAAETQELTAPREGYRPGTLR